MIKTYQQTNPAGTDSNSSNQVDFGQVQLQSDEQRAQEAWRRYFQYAEKRKFDRELRMKLKIISAITTIVLAAAQDGVFDDHDNNQSKPNTNNAQTNQRDAANSTAQNQPNNASQEYEEV
jgi:hypothetical protein